MNCPSCRQAIPTFSGGPLRLKGCPRCGHAFLKPVDSPALTGTRPPAPPPLLWRDPGRSLTADHERLEALHVDSQSQLLRGFHRQRNWPVLIWYLRPVDGDHLPEMAARIDRIQRAESLPVPRIHKLDYDDEYPFLVCDLPEGASFTEAVTLRGVFSEKVVLNMFKGLGMVLENASRANLAGGNLHPSRSFFSPKGDLQLLGPGLWFTLGGIQPGPDEALEKLDIRQSGMLLRYLLTGRSGPGEAPLPAGFTDAFIRGLENARGRSGPGRWTEVKQVFSTREVPPAWLEAAPDPEPAPPPVELPSAPTPEPEPEPSEEGLVDIRSQVSERAKVIAIEDERKEGWRRRWWMLTRGVGGAFVGVALGISLHFTPRLWDGFKDVFISRKAETIGKNAKGHQEVRVGVGPKQHEMVLIPPGRATLGISDREKNGLIGYYPGVENILAREQPQRTLEMKGFLMTRTPITNAQYRQFVLHVMGTGDHSRCHPREPRNKNHVPFVDADWARPYTWNSAEFPRGRDDFPVVLVDWFDAFGYAAWARLRLPTEMEWERVARGDDARRYPWGDYWREGLANSSERIAGYRIGNRDMWLRWRQEWKAIDLMSRHRNTVVRVAQYPAAASPFGVLDMAGNVWQWTSTIFVIGRSAGDPESEGANFVPTSEMVVRGGAWGSAPIDLRTSRRGKYRVMVRDADIGFRCVTDI